MMSLKALRKRSPEAAAFGQKIYIKYFSWTLEEREFVFGGLAQVSDPNERCQLQIVQLKMEIENVCSRFISGVQ